jgi:putative peptidoglycan lipid II flippase
MSTGKQPAVSANRQIARAAGTVMAAFIFSNLVGLARGIFISHAFGTSPALDSFNAANRVAEVLFNLMAGGALGSAFIPTFTGFLTRDDHGSAWRLASAVANLLLVVLSLIAAAAYVFAPQIVRYGLFALAPEVSPGQEALTVHLLRILLPTVVVFGLSGLAMGILNAHQVFLVPAVAPAMYSVGMIGGILLLPEAWGIDRLALGALGGSLLHLLVQIPNLLRLPDRRYLPTLGLKFPALRSVARLMGPRIFGVAVVQMNFVVNTIIALSLSEGSTSAIAVAFSLMYMPQAAIAQSIAIAAMPTFSAQVARGRLEEMRSSLASALRSVLLLSIPASLGLILLRRPLVMFLYQGGEFTSYSTDLVTWALLWYAAGLVGHCVVEVISRAFYALHNTRTPVTVGVIAMTLNIIFSLLFVRWFAAMGWMPHGGLALANSLATGLEAVTLALLMQRRLNGLEGKRVLSGAAAGAAAAALMGLALWGWMAGVQGFRPVIITLGGVALGGLVYLSGLAVLRVSELRLVWTGVKNRLAARAKA